MPCQHSMVTGAVVLHAGQVLLQEYGGIIALALHQHAVHLLHI